MGRTHSLVKTLTPGKIEGRMKRGWQRMRWLASQTQWIWVWASSESWLWTGKPDVLQSMGLQSWKQLSDWINITKKQRHWPLFPGMKIGKDVHLSYSVFLKNLPANARGMDLILGPGRSPGRGHCNPLRYSCLENPMDRGDWQTIGAKSWTQISD